MLTVILGHAEMGLMRLDPAHPVSDDLQEISKSAGRSADLTRQLLAFARKETVSPRILDLNDTVSLMLKMLQRLIGEDIHLNWQPAPELWKIRMDPSQIDQILANLCVNARDAIESNGRIIIATENRTIDEEYCTSNLDAVPGEYVRLTVSDDGHGMDKETAAHIFEPFFTTKELGKGTGLGLATVYGAVKQNNGFINIYSEPGHGTTFSIYLPRHDTKIEQKQTEEITKPLMRGDETILLVEDEPSILKLAEMMLVKLGYKVLKASTPGEALQVAQAQAGEIHMLMTDVILPDMSGRELADKLLSIYPHMKQLFMSGYTDDIIAHHGVLDDGVQFIQKPFSMPSMAAKVREVLDGN
jgi:CheY-like chemotaxis protein